MDNSEVDFPNLQTRSNIEDDGPSYRTSSPIDHSSSTSATTQNTNPCTVDILEGLSRQLDILRQEHKSGISEMKQTLTQEVNDNVVELRRDFCSLQEHVHSLEQRLDRGSQRESNPPQGRVCSNMGSSPMGTANRNENHTVSQLPEHRQIPRNKVTLKPQPFNGQEDFEEYLSQFEIIAQINNWDYYTKSLYLAGCLSGNARAVLTELSHNDRQDFDTLVRVLNMRFGSVERSEIYKAKLQAKMRGKNESLSELAQSVRKLTRLAYPTADTCLTDILALDHFVDSIPDPDIRLRIRELRPRDINEAEIHAIRLEAHRLAERQKSKSVHMARQNEEEVYAVQPQSREKETEEIDIKTLNSSINSLNKTTKTLVETMRTGNVNMPKQQGYQGRQRSVWNGNQSYDQSGYNQGSYQNYQGQKDRNWNPNQNSRARGDNQPNRGNNNYTQNGHNSSINGNSSQNRWENRHRRQESQYPISGNENRLDSRVRGQQ